MTDSALPLAAPTRRSRVALYLDLIRFNRPAGWLVLLWPTLVALWVASDGFPGWHLLAVFVLGTILTRSAGCVINDIADRAFDRHVQRTRTRPLTTGELSVGEAALVGLALTALALALVLTTRREAVAWSALGCSWPSSTRTPSAFCRCRRRCWAWPSASVSPSPSRP